MSLLLHFRPDGSRSPLASGQAMTHSRATVGGMIADTLGYVRPTVYGQPKFEAVDLDGDGIRESLGLTTEDARVNNCPRSEDFGNWTAIRVTVSANAARAPNGTLTADKIVETATTGNHECEMNPLATPAASTYSSLSVFLKASERTWGQITAFRKDGTSSTTYFNLATGVLGTVGANARARIEKYGDGYYRCLVSFDALTGASTCSFGVGCTTGDGVASYAGTAGSGIFAWGAQYEVNQPFPTSYVGPTTTSAVSKNGDAVSLTALWPLQDYTVYAKIARPWHVDLPGDTGQYFFMFRHGSGAAFLELYLSQTSRAVVADLNDGSTAPAVSASIPSGAAIEVCAQYVNLTTAGKCRLDVGAGFGAFSTLCGVMAPDANVYLSQYGGGVHNLSAPLLSLKVAAGARTMAEMQGMS